MNDHPNNFSVHILWEFISGPWGGGNQFLKALRDELSRIGMYADTPEKADIILFNSHQHFDRALRLKLRHPDKIFVHRIDGPLSHARGRQGEKTDKKIFLCNRLIADGTVFQSEWSRQQSHALGLPCKKFETCIINAPDPNIFHRTDQSTITPPINNDKIKLVATSWSSNPRKGFDVYHYLDEHLDVDRYSMTFIGNFDQPFKNIRTIDPLPSIKLADKLREHDLFISASLVESCSNSFLEAMHCGLPALARNNSSHPELLGMNGLLFDGTDDVLQKLDELSENLAKYRTNLTVLPLSCITDRYCKFFNDIHEALTGRRYRTCRLNLLSYTTAVYRLKNSR